MRIFDETTGKGLATKVLSPADMRSTTGKTATTILTLLSSSEGLHASEIARSLSLPEQNVHYHVKKLRDAGVVTIERMQDTQGGTAKVLQLTAPSFSITCKELAPLSTTHQPYEKELNPFVKDGAWNAKIVASSPDPHGPESARGRDVSFAVDLAMFFGSFIETPPTNPLLLDTELRDWNQNLVIIGGPVVNKAAERINTRCAIPYNTETKSFTYEKKTYSQENVGVIVNMENPFFPGKRILLVQGKRFSGTRAAIIAFVKNYKEILSREITIVLGLDADSDGVIDSAEML